MTGTNDEAREAPAFTFGQLEAMTSALWEVIDLAGAAALVLDYGPGLREANGPGEPVQCLHGILRGIHRAADEVLGKLLERMDL